MTIFGYSSPALPAFNLVENPAHYTEGRTHQPLEVIEDWHLGFHLGNAVKYISRAGRTKNVEDDTVLDLQKAIFYINRHIESLKKP